MHPYLDVDFLRKNHQMIHYFGVGFIQIKINEAERLHLYVPDLPSFTEEPHNHRYYFVSEVLVGALETTVWQIGEGDPCILRYDSCSETKAEPPDSVPTLRKKVGTFVTHAGSSYYLPKEVYHQVRPLACPTVTLLNRGKRQCEFASILEPVDFEPVCPFSRKVPEEELWEIVSHYIRGPKASSS